MSSKYAVVGDQTAAAADSILGVTGSATVIPALFYLCIGSPSTPADAAVGYALKRFTAAGTSTAVTPEPLDGNDRVAVAAGGSNHTVEPTYAGVAYMAPSVNQRSVFQWHAHPGGEICAIKTAANGFGLQIVSISSGTPELHATMHFSE